MLIDLLRHGEPQGGRMYRGDAIDDPLSARGWRQMREAVDGLAGWTAILSSPMRRCLAFASELARLRDLPLRVEPDLREMAFGAWEGRRPSELLASDPQAYRAFLADPARARPPGAEAPADLSARVIAVLSSALAQNRAADGEGAHLLVVAHGGVIRVTAAWALGLPAAHLYRFELDYAGICRLRLEPGLPPRLVHFGRAGALAAAQAPAGSS